VNDSYDVVIIGGGLAGLTLARQLRRRSRECTVLVVEQNNHPVPEAAHKVGESCSEMGAHYLREVLGLGTELATQQLYKLGFRFIYTAGDNRDVTRRVEFGPANFPPSTSYQLDRGRLENSLGRQLVEAGVDLRTGTRVADVTVGRGEHGVTVAGPEGTNRVQCRWLVDASGRRALLKRRMGLARKVDHDAHAAWFRIGAPIRMDDWSDDPAWQARVPGRNRYLSTNHLMGRGYWTWLIPLASSSTSVGVVADARHHPFDQLNTFEKMQHWLDGHEPQCADAVRAHAGLLQDFKVMRRYAHDCERVFSPDRWCLTGEAGVFLDPFYSPGTDFIGTSNTYITDLILRDLRGESGVEDRTEAYNQAYLAIFREILAIFVGQLPVMGNPLVMSAKGVWDFGRYWSILALAGTHDKLCDLDFMASIAADAWRINHLDQRMQAFFRSWDSRERREWQSEIIKYEEIPYLWRMNHDLTVPLDDDALRELVAANRTLLEKLAVAMFRRGAGLPGGGDVDPYTFDPNSTAEPYEFDAGAAASGQDRGAAPGSVLAELTGILASIGEPAFPTDRLTTHGR
jgi:flavin-dependent dehydrogenase